MDDTETLRYKFRSGSSLLTLITTACNNGISYLAKDHFSSESPSFDSLENDYSPGADSDSHNSNLYPSCRVLHAIAVLMTRNTEIISVASQEHPKCPGVIAIANPDTDDQYFGRDTKGNDKQTEEQCILLPPGQSHWSSNPELMEWDPLFSIP
jgi:hypothetical protein